MSPPSPPSSRAPSPGADPFRYFIRLRGQVKGPFSVDQLTRMAGRGQFSKLHQISIDQAQWSPATELPGMFPDKRGAAPPVPEPEPVAVAPVAAKEWYYNSGDSKIGPVDEAFIKNLIVSGKVEADTLLWKTGLPNWLEARQFFPNAFASPPRMTAGKWAALAAAVFLTAGIGVGGYLLYTRNRPASAVESASHAPESPSTPSDGSIPKGSIHSTNLADAAVNAAINDATGMVVFYLEIDLTTGEHHELGRGHGTCFVVTPEGHALTNKHVIDEYEKFENATDEGRVRRLLTSLKEVYAVKRDGTGRPVADKDGRPELDPDVIALIDQVETRIGHVEPVLVVYFGSQHYPADLLYSSTRFDMAAIRIDRPDQTAHFALSGQSKAAKLSEVVAFGYPGVSQRAVTDEERAVVAAKSKPESLGELLFGKESHRDSFKASAFELTPTPGQISVVQQETGGIYNVQHTAPIRPGNSGGPLVFREGEQAGVVYGINTLYLKEDSPVYVAFPVAQMREELENEAKIPALQWR
ncbi:GYF domain-containing protein [Planctomyces sp. SH-PL14]|uniref:GYF domain-containing protein n=1 Tax=Planctomyces sp. SH-PL14 TaxID=1632864 RepID=UPI00078ED533|nr:GYF domain-containing protein [Planctomyces sp. SH-PL14]AMV18224.1 serine endoprotease [Planctomyces sp. SH-PL14]